MNNLRNEIIKDLKEKFQHDKGVLGLILAGSSSTDCILNKNSDLDFIVITVNQGGRFEFYHKQGIWVEIFYEDEKRIKKCFDDNDEIMINCFKDGKILIDTKDKLAKLKNLAKTIGNEYNLSDYNLKKLKYRFQVMLLKIKNAYLEKDLDKIIFLCMYLFPYLLRGIYIVNHKIPPTLSLWFSKRNLAKLKGGELAINLFKAIIDYSNNNIDDIYNKFILLNEFLNSQMGGALKEWKDIRKEQHQTFL